MLKIRGDSSAMRSMEAVGVCGEMPVSALNLLHRNKDYDRRVVTKLVNEGYLREWKMEGQKRHVVRSLSLTAKGLEKIEALHPDTAKEIRERSFSPGPAHGDRERAFRMHRNAYCMVMADYLWARWMPGEVKLASIGRVPVYFSAYEVNRLMGWDSKGSRLSGFYIDSVGNSYLFYYLGYCNLHWNAAVESDARHRLWQFLYMLKHYYYLTEIRNILLIGHDWSLAERLVESNGRKYTRLFSGDVLRPNYYTTLDVDGIRIARMMVDSTIERKVCEALEKRGLVKDKSQNDYRFDINRLCAFHPTNSRDRESAPRTGVFLESQRETIERINLTDAWIRMIPRRDWNRIWADLARQGLI